MLKQLIWGDPPLPSGHSRVTKDTHICPHVSFTMGSAGLESKGVISAYLACHLCLEQRPDVWNCNQTPHVWVGARD